MISTPRIGSAVALGAMLLAADAMAIPAFARKYKTSCQTCHVMFPKLTAFGEAVRLNGYQIPGAEDVLVKDEPLALGSEPWKEMWPDTVWPSNIPGLPPIALRVINDIQFQRETDTNFEFPHEIEILAGGRFGEKVGFFVEAEWHQGFESKTTVTTPTGTTTAVTDVDGLIAIKQAYIVVNDLLGLAGLDVPDQALNLRIGLMDLHLLFSYNNTTRVGKNHPLWGNKKASDITIGGLKSGNGFRLQNNQPAIELYSILLDDRLYLGAGVATGSGERRFDENNHKDLYFKVKYKIGGRDFLGRMGDEEITTEAKSTGGWVDNAVLLEAFGYFGEGNTTGGVRDEFWYLGGSVRWTWDDLDLSGGVIVGEHDNPFGTASSADLETVTWFAKGEYMFFPWLMGRVVYEGLDSKAGAPLNAGAGSQDQERILLGPIFLPLANLRIVIEWEEYLEHPSTVNPDALWVRMDWAF